jgi:hypothetical protein
MQSRSVYVERSNALRAVNRSQCRCEAWREARQEAGRWHGCYISREACDHRWRAPNPNGASAAACPMGDATSSSVQPAKGEVHPPLLVLLACVGVAPVGETLARQNTSAARSTLHNASCPSSYTIAAVCETCQAPFASSHALPAQCENCLAFLRGCGIMLAGAAETAPEVWPRPGTAQPKIIFS